MQAASTVSDMEGGGKSGGAKGRDWTEGGTGWMDGQMTDFFFVICFIHMYET